MELFKSPLYEKYHESKAKLINFAGWEMPITFSGLIEEHEAVRNSAGFFDISHMGIISVKGANPKKLFKSFFQQISIQFQKAKVVIRYFLIMLVE